ncbi:unnamed protein product [Withania somnifera]
MGRRWLYWGTGNGTSNKSTQRGVRTKGEEVINNISNEEAPPPPGACMCFQIFDLPHFQLALNQQSCSLKPHHHHPSFLQQHQQPSFLKGLEAPRNSLELDEVVTERKSVCVGIQIRTSCDSRSARVSTSGSRTRTDHDISSECSSNSPAGTKTPSLVARLMGLDLLPENNSSPRISVSTCNTTKSQSKNVINNQMTTHQSSSSNNRRRFSSFESSDTNYITTGTLSLPETPRISSARRSDVDYHQQHQHYHHRLSLQFNKENMGDEFQFSDSSRRRASSGRRSFHQQENDQNQTRSPGSYARQIVKQVKESVSRKVGHDITNTNSIRRKDDQLTAKYDQVVLLKPKKPSKSYGDNHDDFSPSKQTTPSCSPRFRFLEPKSSTSTGTKYQPNYSTTAKSQTSHSPRFSPLSPLAESKTLPPPKIVTRPKSQSSQKEQLVQQNGTIQKRKGEKLVPKKPPQACDAIRSKKEEPFVRSAAATNKANFTDKKCKLKTPLSNQLFNTCVPTILPLRKDPSPTKLLIKQEPDSYPWKRSSTELSSSSSQSSYYKVTTLQEMNRDTFNGATTIPSHALDCHQYIHRILKRTGLDKSTPLSSAKWYSSLHPLDPSIFHYLELFATPNSTLTLRSNRKLIFQLVDEFLIDILKPCGKNNIKQYSRLMHGEELIDTLCARIRSLPSADCQVLEDVDALIDKDMQKWEIGGILASSTSFEEEVESIVCEIERDIMEELVHDTV